jgi:hypothetical protein
MRDGGIAFREDDPPGAAEVDHAAGNGHTQVTPYAGGDQGCEEKERDVAQVNRISPARRTPEAGERANRRDAQCRK